MCIIATCEGRKMTSQEVINCFKNNSDGAGVAYYTEDGKIHVEKGFMTLEEFQDYYETLDVLPHVAHFRIAVIQTTLLGCIDGYTILCAGKQCSTVADFFFCSIIRCCEALFVQQSVMNHLPYNQILVYIVFA